MLIYYNEQCINNASAILDYGVIFLLFH